MLKNNSMFFADVVGNDFGRKIAYTDVDAITRDNVVKVVGNCLGIHNKNRVAISYLWNYYKGNQPIRYRTKTVRDDIKNIVVENHAYEIVQFKTGQTYGEPVLYNSLKDDEKVNKAVDRLNDYMIAAEKQLKDIKSGEWQSAVGTSFKAIQRRDNFDIPFRIVAPSPMNTFVIYSRMTEEPMLAVQQLKDENGDNYMLCFTENRQYKIQNSVVIDERLHSFGDIPIIEYPNNHERLSDIELIIDILDAINNMQSNRMDSIEQFVQSWIKFVNCDIDEEQFAKMKMMGALVVKSNNGGENKADVDVMSQELNQTESQVAKDDLWENGLGIIAMPKLEGNSAGDTQGAVELRNGWDFSKNRAKTKDPLVKSGDRRLGKIGVNILRLNKVDLKLSILDFDVQINHSPTDNLVVKCQALQYLLQCGVHPLIAMKTVGLWGDVEKVFMLSKPYLDNLWKTIDQATLEEETKKAEQALEEFNNKKMINTESTQVPETNADTMSIRK